jgi:hypothetical protein
MPLLDAEIPLVSKRRERAKLLQKLQHGLPAVVLLFEGARRLAADHDGLSRLLAIGEILSSALVVVSMARTLRKARRPGTGHDEHAHGVDWVDIFLAAMLSAEVLRHWHETAHWKRPTILLAIVTLGMGLMHGRIADRSQRRRALRISTDGLSIGGRFRSVFRAAWTDVDHIDVSAGRATIVLRDGRERRLDLADLRNGSQVADALTASWGQVLYSRTGTSTEGLTSGATPDPGHAQGA